MTTMMRVMNNWGMVKDMERLKEDYRLESWDSKDGIRYIIEPATNSGVMVSPSFGVRIIVSGVEHEDYYGEALELGLEDDLYEVFESLREKEPLNVDRYSNVSVFLVDVATRDQVKEAKTERKAQAN